MTLPRDALALSATETFVRKAAFQNAPQQLPEFVATFWKREDGLPDNSVNVLLQTRDGYMWIGTEDGLLRFDGVRFTPVRLTSITNAAPDRVSALCEDAAGNLWVGTEGGGIARYQRGNVTRFTVGNGLPDNRVSSIADDAEGRLWVGTQSGLCQYNGSGFTEARAANGSSFGAVSSIHSRRSGDLWITTPSGIFRSQDGKIVPYQFDQAIAEAHNISILGVYTDRKGNVWAYGDTFLLNLNQGTRFNYFRSSDPSSSRVWTIFEQRNGEMWIGTGGRGLFCLRAGKFEPVGVNSLLVHEDVRSILEDREGNLWLGTYGDGLVRLKAPRSWDYAAAQGLPDTPINALGLGPDGRVWLGFNGSGLYAGQQKQFERLKFNSPLDHENFITSICTDSAGRQWIGARGGGLYVVAPGSVAHYGLASGLADEDILALAAQPGGGIWVGCASGNVNFLDDSRIITYGQADGLTGKPITSLLVRRDGSLVVGSTGGVVYRHGEGFSPLLAGGATNEPITSMLEDQNGRLWLGSAGSGLGRFGAGQIQWLTTREGLPDDHVTHLIEDDEGGLWCGFPQGIYELRKSAIRHWTGGPVPLLPIALDSRDHPVASQQFGGSPSVLKTPDGRLWFATDNGLIVVFPQDTHPNMTPPPVMIESVRIDGKSVSDSFPLTSDEPVPTITISPRMRSVDIDYTALSFVAPERVKFKYKLDHYDADWVEAGTDRKAHYGKLAPGQYSFHVIACNEDGVWNQDGASLQFMALTPFWRLWWFIALAGAATAGFIAGTARYYGLRRMRLSMQRLEQQRMMERERTRIARDMHDEIGSKLTRISFLSELTKTTPPGSTESEQQLAGIARASRELLATLDELVWAVNPRNDNLEHVASYLAQYAGEYFQNTATECRLELPSQLPHCELTSEMRHNLFLAFEESLNNVLKHSKASIVNIRMFNSNGSFEISVADNGSGFDPAAVSEGGNGLSNMRQRLSEIGGHCAISSQPAGGAVVRLVVELPKDSPSDLEK